MTDVATGLDELADQFWERWLEVHPVSATSIGDRRHDDRLDDPSPAGIEDWRRSVEAFRERLEGLNPAGLDERRAITHAALAEELETTEAGLATGFETWTVDPLEGPHIAALNLPDLHTVTSPAQGRSMVARWRALPGWLDAHGQQLRRGLADDRVAVASPVRRVIDELEGLLAAPDSEHPLLAPARASHDDWPAGEIERFRSALAAAVEDGIRPALARYLGIVRDEVLPRARPDTEPGIGRLPGGDAAYRSLIRLHTSLDLPPEEIHAIGLAEVERIDEEMADLGGRVLGARGLPAVLDRLRSDASLRFTTRDEVFATAVTALRRAEEAVPDWFGLRPQARCEVVRMGAHEEAHSTIAYYREPATDGSRPGQYYLNTSEPETRPRYEAEALAWHEAVPGHHLQIALAQELTGLPAFRRHLGPTAYFEGWGLYTERLADEMGLYSGDLDRIGILSFDGWRACRLVVDTGMHALGWTRSQAIEFMVAHTALGANNIANEVDRYIVWPGQALAYKLGQLELLRLRREARERQGDRFDVRAFHDAVLGEGALGLAALRSVVERALA